MKSRGRTRYLTPDEEQRLLSALPEKYRDVVMFLLDTGARISEALNLRWDVLAHDPSLSTATFHHTKNGQSRTLLLTKRAQECLVRARAAGYARPFVLTYHATWVAFRRAVAAAGLDDGGERLVLHSTRHTAASRLVQRGAPLLLVSHFLGHSNIAQTVRYAHINPEMLRPLTALLEQSV